MSNLRHLHWVAWVKLMMKMIFHNRSFHVIMITEEKEEDEEEEEERTFGPLWWAVAHS